MNDADRVHVVAGASGGTGSALVRELVAQGRRMRAVNRSGQLAVPDGVEVAAGDAIAQVQRPVKVLRITEARARALGLVWPVLREGAEMLYQFRQPHSVDATAYRTAFGDGRVTPYERGIEQTLGWYRSTPARRLLTLGR